MSLEQTTPVPNRLFDLDLISLKEVELKVLLIIIRKTLGWAEATNRRQRKQIARISIAAFVMNTGCSKRGISGAIEALIGKGLISVFDEDGLRLLHSEERKGKYNLYFKPSLPLVENRFHNPKPRANFSLKPEHNLPYTIKEREQKKREGLNLESFQSRSSYHITRYLQKHHYDR